MCFSATASFSISAVLVTGGISILRKFNKLTYVPFAIIPFFFAIQQFTEGLVWLSLTNAAYAFLNFSTTSIYLFFAEVLWPILVPIAIYLIDKDSSRKYIFYFFILIGFVTSAYFSYCLLNYPYIAVISGNHISYELDFPYQLNQLSGVFYFVATVLPAFISKVKYIFYFGFVILLSFVTTKFFYNEYLISIWCYFAAVISLCIFFILNARIDSDSIFQSDIR